MGFRSICKAIQAENLKAPEKLILILLASNASDDNGHCWRNQKRLAEEAGLTRAGTNRILKRLEEKGLVRIDPKPGKFCNFELFPARGGVIEDHRQNLPDVIEDHRGCDRGSQGDVIEDHNRKQKLEPIQGTKEEKKAPSGASRQGSLEISPPLKPESGAQAKKGLNGLRSIQIPAKLHSERFEQLWWTYIHLRQEMKCPISKIQAQALVSRLEGWGRERSIEALKHSIENGYKGVFEPKKGEGINREPAGAIAGEEW